MTKKKRVHYIIWQNFDSPLVEDVTFSSRLWSRKFHLDLMKLLRIFGIVGVRFIFDPRFMTFCLAPLLYTCYRIISHHFQCVTWFSSLSYPSTLGQHKRLNYFWFFIQHPSNLPPHPSLINRSFPLSTLLTDLVKRLIKRIMILY